MNSSSLFLCGSLMSNNNEVCTCGRDYIHCKVCGKRNPYFKQAESGRVSKKLGQFVNVRRCQTCGNETHELTPCTAESVDKPIVPFVHAKEKDASVLRSLPQFLLTFGTPEYFDAFTERFNWLVAHPKHCKDLSPMDAMRSEGWQTDSDSPVLGERGANSGGVNDKMDEGQSSSEPVELTLDQVIEKMKEEQK
jgi:hypothetical protein